MKTNPNCVLTVEDVLYAYIHANCECSELIEVCDRTEVEADFYRWLSKYVQDAILGAFRVGAEDDRLSALLKDGKITRSEYDLRMEEVLKGEQG